MSIWIDQFFCESIKREVQKKWPRKKVVYFCEPRSWQRNRYIQIETSLRDMDIHYEVINNHVQFHIEGKFTQDIYKPFIRFLRESVPTDGVFHWRRWQSMTPGMCEVIEEVFNEEDILEKLELIVSRFDPIIEKFVTENPEIFPEKNIKDVIPPLAYTIDEIPSIDVDPTIVPVGELPFDEFSIPTYQRPYKWTAKNVNQLISDILTFSNKNKLHYRLGTLVLHWHPKDKKYEIVDGQQRIVTLVLLIQKMFEGIKEPNKRKLLEKTVARINVFANNTSFQNRYSLHNVIENLHVIETRKSDLQESILDFLLNNCEFVVVKLNDITEAFQFFDSQNARGKDLEAHDLLKAYHLREIPQLSEPDSNNINHWQSQRTSYLKTVFLSLYRAKRWSQGKSARYFTKGKIDIFKGVSLRDGKRYPFYQMEIIAHIFSELYNNDLTRYIDQRSIEYPFNLDDQIINGSRFFDMLRHYMALYNKVQSISVYPADSIAEDIMKTISNYEGMGRKGDQYVSSMFYTTVLYYVDRFGMEELDKIIPKIFVWAYSLRLDRPAIQLATIDNYACRWESVIRIIHDAKTPYDIINITQDSIDDRSIVIKKCEKIIELFRRLNKINHE